MRTPSVCVIGDFHGYFSHNVVSRGIMHGLAMPPSDLDVSVYDIYHGFRASYHDIGAVTICDPGEADVWVFVGGYPPMLKSWYHRLGGKRPSYALAICESALAPPDWRATCEAGPFEQVWAPSAWAANALGAEVLFHGVEPRLPGRAVSGASGALHVCGAASFPERKGTPQLIEAWRQLADEGIVSGSLNILGEALLRDLPGADHASINVVVSGGGRAAANMARLYQSYTMVVQPSRAEAFGLVPLEALLQGRTVVATGCTGHASYVPLWKRSYPTQLFVVEHGPNAPITVNGIPNGVAPTVSAEAIYNAVREAAKYNPEGVYVPHVERQAWSWTETTAHMRTTIERKHA